MALHRRLRALHALSVAAYHMAVPCRRVRGVQALCLRAMWRHRAGESVLCVAACNVESARRRVRDVRGVRVLSVATFNVASLWPLLLN
jgi:hypothetical protein